MLYYYPNKPMLTPIESSIIDETSQNPDYWAEIKKNGSRLALRKSKSEAQSKKSFGDFVFYNGHQKIPLTYEPCPEVLEELNSFKIPEGTHVDAELMHQKTKHIKHFIYVYDIYFYKGRQVLETLEVRRRMIEDLFGGLAEHFTLAQIYTSNFRELFNEVIKVEENEGLVIKSKQGRIEWNLKKSIEVWWQIKVRKPNKNYHF